MHFGFEFQDWPSESTPSYLSVLVAVYKAAEAQFPPKAKTAGEASRASPTEDGKLLAHTQARAMDCQPRKRKAVRADFHFEVIVL
jgi:hypothetical protein